MVGTLHLDVLEAEGLPVGDITGKSDPYAMVGLGITVASAQLSKMQKTSVRSRLSHDLWMLHDGVVDTRLCVTVLAPVDRSVSVDDSP